MKDPLSKLLLPLILLGISVFAFGGLASNTHPLGDALSTDLTTDSAASPIITISTTPISDQLIGKTIIQKENIKGVAIAAASTPGSFTKNTLSIEIESVTAIDDGVQVYARAFSNGKQLGFGADGSVEYERFRVHNPPILVPDQNGSVIRQSYSDINKATSTTTYREDPQEAIRQVLAHAIPLVGKLNTNIIPGKHGNTTDISYPNAGSGSAPIDGRLQRCCNSNNETFSTISTSAGQNVSMTDTRDWEAFLSSSATSNRFNNLIRWGGGFSTSAVGSDTVTSATLSLYGSNKTTALGSTDIDVVSFSPANAASYANSDYSNFGTTRYATGIPSASWSTTGYNDFTLNATGIAAINGSGNTHFGLRLKWDVDGTFGGSWVSNSSTGFEMYSADQIGTTNDPMLTVTHAAAGGGASPVQNQDVIFFDQ